MRVGSQGFVMVQTELLSNGVLCKKKSGEGKYVGKLKKGKAGR